MSGITFTSSQRGKILLIYNNNKFSMERLLKTGEQKWRCCKKGCLAFVKVVGVLPNLHVTVVQEEHKHDACNDQLSHRQDLTSRIKQKAIKQPLERPDQLVKECLDQNPSSTRFLQKQDLKYAKRNAYNVPRKTVGFLPKDAAEVHEKLKDMEVKTARRENFLLVNNQHSNILVFSCSTNLIALRSAEAIYMDGTFLLLYRFLYRYHYQIRFHYRYRGWNLLNLSLFTVALNFKKGVLFNKIYNFYLLIE